MKSKKTTRRALFSSFMALLLCCSMLVGTTFAWFTDSVTSTGNIIKSGTLDVKLYYGDKTDAMTELTNDTKDAIFNYELWEPGFTQTKYIKIENAGDLALKYQLHMLPADREGDALKLAEVIDVYCAIVDDGFTAPARDTFGSMARLGTLKELMAKENGVDDGILLPAGGKGSANVAGITGEIYTGEVTACIALHMQESAGNDYQDLSVGKGFNIQLIAAQMTYENDSFDHLYDENSEYDGMEYPVTVDVWDGAVDTSWYTANPDAQVFSLSSAEQLAGLAALVDGDESVITADARSGIEQLPVSFAGKTVNLDTDVDLGGTCFEPIGSYRNDVAFMGSFDGQGHTIYNMSQNTWALDNGYYYGDLGLGLFGKVEDAEIKNLTMDGASISGEYGLVGIVAGAAYGNCTFENISVKNSQGADYQYYAGGIVGWASGSHQYINCDIDASTTIATQWGDFDNSTGGIIGGAAKNASILMKDCDVACRIDAYNDVTSSYQWYAYRRCGMLIGNSGNTKTNESGTTVAAAPQLTCENVTVTYGDWANYTYCEFAGKSWPYVRVQAGVSNSAYSNPRYGHPTDANGNEVVNDNHVHNEGEDHFMLCVFDQLYGGGQGVYGTATHDGVTVIYNNK